jgi:hypothetical protein
MLSRIGVSPARNPKQRHWDLGELRSAEQSSGVPILALYRLKRVDALEYGSDILWRTACCST